MTEIKLTAPEYLPEKERSQVLEAVDLYNKLGRFINVLVIADSNHDAEILLDYIRRAFHFSEFSVPKANKRYGEFYVEDKIRFIPCSAASLCNYNYCARIACTKIDFFINKEKIPPTAADYFRFHFGKHKFPRYEI